MSCYVCSRESFVLSACLGIVFPYVVYERAQMTTIRKPCIKLHTDLPHGKSTGDLMWLLTRECSKRCVSLLKWEVILSKL